MALKILPKRFRPPRRTSGATLPEAQDYPTWQRQFLRDRLILINSLSILFLGVLAYLNLVVVPRALERSGATDSIVLDYGIPFLVCLFVAQLLALLLNLIWLSRPYPFSHRQTFLAFLSYVRAVQVVPLLQHLLIGKSMMDLGGWTIFFLLQAVLIPVQWRWHLATQLGFLALLILSFVGLGFPFVGIEPSMQALVFTVAVVVLLCVFCVADLGIYLYETLLRREFELRQQLQLFLHAVSHDLRNPVTGTLMLLQNLPQQNGNFVMEPGVLTQVIKSHERQLTLINSLLEAHHQDVQGVTLQLQAVHLPVLVENIVQDLHPLIVQSQGTVKSRVSPDLPLIHADPLQLRRVYENLITNALQYNPAGVNICLEASVQGSFLHCTVSDDGQGICGSEETPSAKTPRTVQAAASIFDCYNRGRDRRRPLHLGLGLYICQQIITAHQGQLGVDSNPGQGTTFWFTLPIKPHTDT